MLAFTLAAAVLVGLTLGLLGGGGSILTVPILVYLAGLHTKQAITASLFVVGVTSAVALLAHAQAGRVRWRAGAIVGAAGMAGAYAGGRLAALIPDTWLLVGFAVIMVATAAAMIRGRRRAADQTSGQAEPAPTRLLAVGLAVGTVTGLLGAGGGFLIVPALALFAGLPMATAVATSLLVIIMNSAAGLAGHLATATDLNWPLTAAVTAAAIAGSLVGGHLAGRVPAHLLRTGFGWFVLAMGAFVLAQQVPPTAWHTLAHTPVTGATLAALVLAAGAVTARRHHRQGPHAEAVRHRLVDTPVDASPDGR